MKFKTTLVLLGIFIVLLAAILFFEPKIKKETETGENLTDLPSEDIEKILFQKDGETIEIKKNEKGEWLMISPLEAMVDTSEVNRLVDDFSRLKIERVVELQDSDPEKYGIPSKQVSLFLKNQAQPVKILIGMENSLDSTFFAKKEGDPKIVLIPSHLKSLLEKTSFNFRKKDIFEFETDAVRSLALSAKNNRWKAEKKEEDWHLERPGEPLLRKSKINDILYSLSNLKAEEFVSEKKTNEELKTYGLDKADYEIELWMPSENKEIRFSLKKKEDKLFATTSDSLKIISVQDSILSSLEKEADEIRDKKVASFYSWEVSKLYIKKEDKEFSLTKDEDNNWHFLTPEEKEADKSKVETFIRKIESLEAAEFIDPPFELEDYGLDTPQAEIILQVKEEEDKSKEVALAAGREDKDGGRVAVKNAGLAYLFWVDSSFLEDFPMDTKAWEPEKTEENSKN